MNLPPNRTQTSIIPLSKKWALAFFCLWISMQNTNLNSGWKRGQQGFAQCCSQVCWGQADVAVCLEKNMFIRTLPPHALSVALHVTTPPPRLSLALAIVLTISARRFQRTHPFSGMGLSLDASMDIGMEVTDLTPISELVMDAGFTAVVGSAVPCLFKAGSDCKDRSSDVCYVGDTRQSFSIKMMTSLCTVIISAESCHIATRFFTLWNFVERQGIHCGLGSFTSIDE